jgi:hypothetical protein
MSKNNQKKSSQGANSVKGTDAKAKSGHGLAVLGGLVVAAIAGTYYVHGSKPAQKKIKQVKGWALKAKGEVLQKIETLKEVNEDLYHKAVDAIMSRYINIKNIDMTEVQAVTKELKSHWKNIKRELSGGTKVAKKTVKKATKVAKKVAGKAVDAINN